MLHECYRPSISCYPGITRCIKKVKKISLAFFVVYHFIHSYTPSVMGGPQAMLTGAMRDLYDAMGKTTEGFPPLVFLQVGYGMI